MARFPTKQSHLLAWFWGRALKIFTSSLTISIQLTHLISTCALGSKWRTSMQWATLSCLRTAFQYALNTVYESMNNSVYKQSCSFYCGLLHTWLIVLSCCRTSNTSSCFSKNEPPYANEAAQCQTKRPDERMAFCQWKGRPSGVGQKTTTFKAGTLFSKYIPSLKCTSRESSFPHSTFSRWCRN